MNLDDFQAAAVGYCFAAEDDRTTAAALGDTRAWPLYRQLIRKRMLGELKTALERTHAAAGEAAFERAFTRYLGVEPPDTRFFHALVGCFAASAAPFFRSLPELAPHLGDLCEYEAARWAVGDLPDSASEPRHEFSFERRALLSPAIRLLSLEHAVHREADAAGGYARGAFQLCLYRRPHETQASFMLLNGSAYALLGRLAASDESVADAVRQIAAERSVKVDDAFLDGLCTVLADLIERGIVLGSY